MEEDQVQVAQVHALQPGAAQSESNQNTLGSKARHSTPEVEAGKKLDLQRSSQQASAVAEQPNKIIKSGLDENPPEVIAASAIAIQTSELRDQLHVFSRAPITAKGSTASFAGLGNGGDMNGDSASPELGADGQEFQAGGLDHTSWPGPSNSDGSYGASQVDTAPSASESEEHQIQAFAKLEFDDGEFYMNTYAVELGRDIEAARLALERDIQVREGTDSSSRKQSASNGDGSIVSEEIKQEEDGNLADSVVSESGGVIADHNAAEGWGKTKRKKFKTSSPSSRQLSRKGSMPIPVPKVDYNTLAMESLMDHSAMNGFGPGNPLPPPELTPLIPIHSPMKSEGGPISYKSISRKHIKIAFNFDKHYFQVEIIGRNGCFVDDEWYAPGVIQPLVNGSIIQIGGVGIRFVLPDVPPGETGAEMGMDSDLLSGGNLDLASSSDRYSEEGDDGNEAQLKEEEDEEPEKVRTRGRGKKKAEPPPPQIPKRKGPGRPPKNGIISKRNQALLAKQAREDAKDAAQKGPGKGKSSKDAKSTKCGESTVQANGKRKYTKRKRVGGVEDHQGVRESTEHTDSVPPEQTSAAAPPKPAKDKKPPKPPRSPSPVFDESTMTAEQLAKPQSSYVVLIHEALTNSKAGQMSLPQIYRAIERKYPFYKLRVQTQGWQSSVRHNLSQHPAFRKIERDGKGWMWGLVPEVSIEKDKKRRATPPPVSQQHYYQQGPTPMMQRPYPYPSIPPMNGRTPPAPYGMHPGMPHPLPLYGRPGFPLPLATAQSEPTYQSPYQSTTSPAATQSTPQTRQPANSNGANSVNNQNPTPTSQPSQQQSDNTVETAGPSSIPYVTPNSGQQQQSSSHGTSTQSNTNHDSQDIGQAITRFKSALIRNMDDKAKAEKLVTSAINRTLGVQSTSRDCDTEEDPQEKPIMTALTNMLVELSKKNVEVRHPASDSLPQVSKFGLAPAAEGGSAAAIAAEIAAKSALTRGGPIVKPPNGPETPEARSGTKRLLKSIDDNGTDNAQPEAKRVAVA